MRWIVMTLLGLLVTTGCIGPNRGASSGPAQPSRPPPLIVGPSPSVRGKIVVVNPSARYVIFSYPLGHVPQPDRRLAVYRDGLKVASIKVGTQRLDTNAVADILTGECQPGDEVREQ